MNYSYHSYEKIPEDFNSWKLTESDYRTFKKTHWVVTEKIHGANFSLITDGKSVSFAKRKEILEPEENFFGFHAIKAQLIEQILAIHALLKPEYLSIYGELFGGEYPHPDVTPIDNVQAIQTGVYYSPSICYCAFDIAVESLSTKDRVYLDYDQAIKLFQQVGMFYTHPLFIGKYEEACDYNIEFTSTIPRLLGLPHLSGVNKAEGVVIKPVKTFYLETNKGKIRPILKRKIAEFAEDNRFHQAEKWNYSYYQPVVNTYSDLSKILLSLVTKNRLNNVISKLGKITPKMKKKLVELLVADVLESFSENYHSQFEALSPSEQKNIKAELQEAATNLVTSQY